MALLKEEHGLTHGYANLIALQALESDSHTASDTGALVDVQYAGAKGNLRSIYEKLLAAVQEFGDDVKCLPRRPMLACAAINSSPLSSLQQPPVSTWGLI
jgi:hypothetical protein